MQVVVVHHRDPSAEFRIEGVAVDPLQVVKESICTVLPRFSTRRMVKEYARVMYQPALRRETLAK